MKNNWNLKNILRGWLFAAAGFILATQAHSQEPTVEGAQQFLRELSHEGALTFEYDAGFGFNVMRGPQNGNGSYYTEGFRAIPVKDTSEGRNNCSTRFAFPQHFIAPMPAFIGRSVHLFNHPLAFTSNFLDRSPPDSNPGEPIPGDNAASLDWVLVAKVDVNQNSVIVGTNFGRLRFNLTSDSLAKRTGFAMEFLRVKCDRKSATGF
jgi:hypothetical protein